MLKGEYNQQIQTVGSYRSNPPVSGTNNCKEKNESYEEETCKLKDSKSKP